MEIIYTSKLLIGRKMTEMKKGPKNEIARCLIKIFPDNFASYR